MTTDDRPLPDTMSPPDVAAGQTVVGVVYSRSNRLRAVTSVDASGLYRVKTEFWNVSDWEVARFADWSCDHEGTFTDTADNAQKLSLELIASSPWNDC
jgi:hypothetical protein